MSEISKQTHKIAKNVVLWLFPSEIYLVTSLHVCPKNIIQNVGETLDLQSVSISYIQVLYSKVCSEMMLV